MMQVFAAICGVDRIVERGIGGPLERDILRDAAGHDMAVAPLPRPAVPGSAVAVSRPHIEIGAVAYDPDRHRLSRRAVAPNGHDLQFVRRSDLVKLVSCPMRHRRLASAKLPSLR